MIEGALLRGVLDLGAIDVGGAGGVKVSVMKLGVTAGNIKEL